MFEQQQQKTQREPQAEAAKESGTDPFVIAAGVSVLLSQYAFFVQRNRELGIFVGLWPPTFLAFGSYFNQLRMEETLNYITSSRGLMDALDRMMKGR